MRVHAIAKWIRQRLKPEQLADVVAQRALVGDLIWLPEWWGEEEVIEAVELLSAQPPRFKVVPTPDHGTRLVPTNPTPNTEEEWLAAACEHDITYGQEDQRNPLSKPAPYGSPTAGPWEVGDAPDSRVAVYGHGNVCVAVVGEQGYPVVDADARLIAAAPELLDAARDLVSMFERGYVRGQTESTGNAFIDGVDKMRAAIAKATGGAL